MKYRIGRALNSLSTTVLLFAGMCHAQQANQVIKVSVPFEFKVGHQSFPAGEYSIATDAPGFLALRDSYGRVLSKVLTNRVESAGQPESSKLEFLSYGDQHVLVQVWRQGETRGYELAQPRRRTLIASGRVPHTEAVTAETRP